MPRMVDISDKQPCKRRAIALSSIELNPDIVGHLQASDGSSEIHSPKGAVFHTAILAGIQAVKLTPRLIPLCHNIPLSACDIAIDLEGTVARIRCEVASHYATGVEMEAITGAAMAAITIYDMCKGINSDMVIGNTYLLQKTKEPI